MQQQTVDVHSTGPEVLCAPEHLPKEGHQPVGIMDDEERIQCGEPGRGGDGVHVSSSCARSADPCPHPR